MQPQFPEQVDWYLILSLWLISQKWLWKQPNIMHSIILESLQLYFYTDCTCKLHKFNRKYIGCCCSAYFYFFLLLPCLNGWTAAISAYSISCSHAQCTTCMFRPNVKKKKKRWLFSYCIMWGRKKVAQVILFFHEMTGHDMVFVTRRLFLFFNLQKHHSFFVTLKFNRRHDNWCLR